jgi:4-hydroxy-tetrahydrodipicolinate synthase
MVERLAEIPNVVGLKWATPRTDAMEFEDVTSHFSRRFTIIDNNLFFAYSATRPSARRRSRSISATTGRNGA